MSTADLKRLFLAHQRELRAYLLRRLRDPDMAADLTQETFLRYAEQSRDATAVPLHSERSYLYRTAHNLAVDHVRQSARRRTDSVDGTSLSGVPEERPDQERAAAARERLDRLGQAVEKLPERTRQIFLLNRVEGLTYPEVARRLGLSESSVQKHLAAALRELLRRVPDEREP